MSAVPLEPSPPPSDEELSPYLPNRRRLSDDEFDMDVDRDPIRYNPGPQDTPAYSGRGVALPAVPRAPSSHGSHSPPHHHQQQPPTQASAPTPLNHNSRSSLVSPAFSNQPPLSTRQSKQPWNQPPLADWNPYSPHATVPPPGLLDSTSLHQRSGSGGYQGGDAETSPHEQRQPSLPPVNPPRGRPPKHPLPPKVDRSQPGPAPAPSSAPVIHHPLPPPLPPTSHDVGGDPYSSFAASPVAPAQSPQSGKRKRKSIPNLPNGPEGSGLLIPMDAEPPAPAAKAATGRGSRRRNNPAPPPQQASEPMEPIQYHHPSEPHYSRPATLSPYNPKMTTSLPPISSIPLPPPPQTHHASQSQPPYPGPPPVPIMSRPRASSSASNNPHQPPRRPSVPEGHPDQMYHQYPSPETAIPRHLSPQVSTHHHRRESFPNAASASPSQPPILPPPPNVNHPSSPEQPTTGIHPATANDKPSNPGPPAPVQAAAPSPRRSTRPHTRNASSTSAAQPEREQAPPVAPANPPTHHQNGNSNGNNNNSNRESSGSTPREYLHQNGVGETDGTRVDAEPSPSSDLDDHQEVWRAELGSYIVEDRRKAKAVEGWFDNTVVERNEEAQRGMIATYNERMDAIARREREAQDRERDRVRQQEMAARAREHEMAARSQQDARYRSGYGSEYPPHPQDYHYPHGRHPQPPHEYYRTDPASRRSSDEGPDYAQGYRDYRQYDSSRRSSHYTAEEDAARELEAAASAPGYSRPPHHHHHHHHDQYQQHYHPDSAYPPPRLGTKRSRIDSTDSFYRDDEEGGGEVHRDAAKDLEMDAGGAERRRKRRRDEGDEDEAGTGSGFDAAEELEREVLQGEQPRQPPRGRREFQSVGGQSVEDELADVAGLRSPDVAPRRPSSSNGWRRHSEYDERQRYPGPHDPAPPGPGPRHQYENGHYQHHQAQYHHYHHRPHDEHPYSHPYPPPHHPLDSDSRAGATPPPATAAQKPKKRASTKRKSAAAGMLADDAHSSSARSTPIPFPDTLTPSHKAARSRGRDSQLLYVDDRPLSSRSGSAAPSSVVPAPPVFEWMGRGDPGYDFRGEEEPGTGAVKTMVVYPENATVPVQPAPERADKTTMAKRLHDVESAQMRVWLLIARDQIPKVYKIQSQGYAAKLSTHRRVSGTAVGLKGALRHLKKNDAVFRAKKITKDVGNYWRRADKEELENRKRLEREAFQQNKAQEENREAERQARKLEFLITQTELYSHFVGKKDKGADAEASDDEENDLPDFDKADSETIRKHATKNAQKAAARARRHQAEFAVADGSTAEEAPTTAPSPVPQTGAEKAAAVEKEVADLLASRMAEANKTQPQAPAEQPAQGVVDLDSDELNFQNPTSMTEELTVSQPAMLDCTLKDYQLKGLNWLSNLYDKGINGILADEMGLGKTVQSISMLSHLAEHHNIWGPFLVVAPASTLHNWHQELTRFVPTLKAIPYWGTVKDRQTLRKYWANDRNQIWTKDSECHVVVTSYTMITQDDKYFQSVNWQFLILDEAQAIKNSGSMRWKTLLGLKTRNRLLLTGTPIQNRMQELWALLHFIMPSLFDSHDEFSEWFSKDIENQSENKGNGGLTEQQLRRLHLILKPFMLRRVKRMVQSELSEKIEIDIVCDLSPKQRTLYRRLRSNISIAELLTKAQHMGEADSVQKLMNLIMQFRKVCNHPELFERTDIIAPYAFCRFGRSVADFLREGDLLSCPDSWQNQIELSIPALFWREGGLLHVPGERTRAGSDTHWLQNLMNIWSTDWMEKSLRESGSAFSFLPLLDISPSEAHQIYFSRPIRRLLDVAQQEHDLAATSPFLFDPYFAANSSAPLVAIQTRRISPFFEQANSLPRLDDISSSLWTTSYLSRRNVRSFITPVVAPPISMFCADRSFVEYQERSLNSPLESLAFYGLPRRRIDDIPSFEAIRAPDMLPTLPSPLGLLGDAPLDQLPIPPMQVPDANRLIFDSAKLARLDSLLQELKAGGHRVLIYFQMTKMIDLMEEYLVYRQYKYLRLDGSSKIEDRRDMVTDWQTRPDIFIFLLSTHAGGLGINLTAADTVIFYENDWNPSNDSQAMDRAHRIGQTKQVTVYRLITRGTIDERIVQLARVKKDVSDIVVGNKGLAEIAKPTEIVSLLLDDDELKDLDRGAIDSGAQRTSSDAAASGMKWYDDDGDDFFGGGQPNVVNEDEEEFAGGQPAPAPVAKPGKPKGKGRASTRGKRKSAAASQRESVA